MERQLTDTVKFDERRKLMTRTIHGTQDIVLGAVKVGVLKENNTQEYQEDGIRYVLGELKAQKLSLQQALGQASATIEATKHLGEMTQFEKDLKEALQRVAQLEKRTQEQ